MIIESKKKEWDDLSERIIFGVRKAVRKLVEESAANDESLIIGDGKGNFGPVPAKELLKNYDK
jgi:hypothetical protein